MIISSLYLFYLHMYVMFISIQTLNSLNSRSIESKINPIKLIYALMNIRLNEVKSEEITALGFLP